MDNMKLEIPIQLKYSCFDSQLGPIFILAGQKGFSRIIINKTEKDCLKELQLQYQKEITEDESALAGAVAAIKDYLAGKRQNFNFKLERDFDLSRATDFQKRVWQVLGEIPYGQTRSYQWVARRINLPQGARAVGAANRSNPLPIIIPCHRVINANGELGGYRGGTEIKKALLTLEARSVYNS